MQASAHNKPTPSPNKTMRFLLVILLAWLLPAAWVTLTPPLAPLIRPAPRTQAWLKINEQALESYFREHKKMPENFSVLRAYAVSKNIDFKPYDAYGQRFDYVRLSAQHYILRSFGQDGTQNTLSTPRDHALARWGQRPQQGLTYRYAMTPLLDIYPAVLLLSADSPDKEWSAKLFTDGEQHTRYLVLRHQVRPNLFMIAAHDGVEEFLWLPGSQGLIFSATSSTRYRDGLYYWDLRSDQLINLLDIVSEQQPITPNATAQPLWLSLAGINKTGPTVYAYYGKAHDQGLDPAHFFARSRLIAFVIPEKRGAPPRPAALPTRLAPSQTQPFMKPLSLSAHMEALNVGLKAQKTWLALELNGDMEQVLVEWQKFTEKEVGSPLFPYCLWILSSLYSEAFSTLASTETAAANTLRNYGSEIASALTDYHMAPSYLRSLALYTYEQLTQGKPLPYQFGRLTKGSIITTPKDGLILPDNPSLSLEEGTNYEP